MSQETINVGTSPNSGTGDKIRDAFIKVSNNFTELYSSKAQLEATSNAVYIASNLAYAEANSAVISVGSVANTTYAFMNIANIAFGQANLAFNKANNFLVTKPNTSTGSAGDTIGMFAANAKYLYYCTETYFDGANNIWKRVSWSADTW